MQIAFHQVPFSPEQREKLTAMVEAAGRVARWYDRGVPSPEQLADCEALLGLFPPALLPQLPRLKWVQLPYAGADAYCPTLRQLPQVTLTNSSGAFGTPIAEYCLMGILMLFRHMPAYGRHQQRCEWVPGPACRTIEGSRFVIVGAGNLGQSLALRLKALGGHTVGVRRRADTCPEGFDEMYPQSRLAEAVSGADAVIACLPSTPDTVGLISEEIFRAMPEKAVFVNCGRGVTVDQAAMTAALREGRIAGAVLDVVAQ